MPDFNSIFLTLTRVFFMIGSILYLVFAIVIVRQVAMMAKNVYDKFNGILVTFSYLHLAFSVVLVLLTFVLTI